MAVNLNQFNHDAKKNQRRYRSFITRLGNSDHENGVLQTVKAASDEVWQNIDCLSCGNCCKTMTPTFTPADKRRIAKHLGISIPAFTAQYLTHDPKVDQWSMRQQPCPFLNLGTNKCSIYALRPADCSGFPHLVKTPLKRYMHIHKQNLAYCPATLAFIQKLTDRIQFSNVAPRNI